VATETGTCRLCLQERVLQNSHIIPEFFYKPIYDPKHQFLEVATKGGVRNPPLQKGVREALLCWDCEQLLNKEYENYTRDAFYGQGALEFRQVRNSVTVRGLDYRRLKLCFMSILWRASLSSQKFFSLVDLGHEKEERLRRMLLEREAGQPWDFGFVGLLAKLQGEPADQFMLQPHPLRFEGLNCYRFFFGGCLWLFCVSKEAQDFPLREYTLQPSGQMTFALIELTKTNLFQRLFRELGKLGDPHPPVGGG
jgi:hypothetical protein